MTPRTNSSPVMAGTVRRFVGHVWQPYLTWQTRHVILARMKIRTVDAEKIREARGKDSREVIAHALRQRGHATDAKAIWRWETGKNQPSARVLPDLAEVLGLKIDDLFEDVTPPFERSRVRDMDAPLDRDDFEMLGALMARLGVSLEPVPQEEVRS